MNVLIIGRGGREHALAWKAAQSEQVEQVFIANGNGGTITEPKVSNIDIDILDFASQVDFAKNNHIALTLVGPEDPLVFGVVDHFQENGLHCFGPTRMAAQLEASKTFSKEFMQRHNIPTAEFASFTDVTAAKQYVQDKGAPIVIKADGLAAGKGVEVCLTMEDALLAIDNILTENIFGEKNSKVLIEQYLPGEEASFMVISDGEQAIPLATSQDYKALQDGDKGPNTGGMGAYSPAPVITPELHQHIMDRIINPTIKGMADEGHPYVGFLYAGLMISPDHSVKVLEFNCRLGDPETQPLMMRLRSDLVALCSAALTKQLDRINIDWDRRSALGVVLTAGGYPHRYAKGDVITGIHAADDMDNVKVFHAATLNRDDKLFTAGGRVLCVTALGDTVLQAQQQAYAVVDKIYWPNMYYRTDIGYRAIRKAQQTASVSS